MCERQSQMQEADYDGELESARQTGEERLRQQERWLSQLPRDFHSVLDIGAGAGFHSRYFLDRGKRPIALDRYPGAFLFRDSIEIIERDLFEVELPEKVDAVFCSHVLEHFADPAAALRKIRSLLKDDGYLFVVVPPYQPLVVNYHWHTGWNCTQLAMFMAALGFDCANATFLEHAGNVCGWGRKRDVPETKFILRRSLPLLPRAMCGSFFVKDGYEFLPGNIVYADAEQVRLAGAAGHFAVPEFRFSDYRELVYGEEQSWQSAEVRFDAAEFDFSDGDCTLIAAMEGGPVALRIAVGQNTAQGEWGNCSEYYLNPTPGMNCYQIRSADFTALRGRTDFAHLQLLSIGGQGARARILIWCYRSDGVSVLT